MMNEDLPAPLRLSMTHANRALSLCEKSARLALTQPAPEVAGELMALQRATLDRFAAMQGDWVARWREWGDYAAAINQARTGSIFAEHGMNTLTRAQKIMSDQVTATLELTENVAVSYGYWLDRRLGGG